MAIVPGFSPITVGSGPDSIAINVSEDAYNGDAQFVLSVDGVQIGGVQTASVPHSERQQQTFLVNGNFGAGPHVLGVNFLNDAYGGSPDADRNLWIGTVQAGGVTYATEIPLFNNGLRTLDISLPDQPVTIGSGRDVIGVHIAEDAYLGDAQFTISVNDVQIDGVQTATTSRSSGQDQLFNMLGDFGIGPLTLTVNFLNDAYGGTPDTDRNLYVNWIDRGGYRNNIDQGLFSGGPATFSLAAVQPPTGPVTFGNGPDSIVLGISEDAYQGDAQFTVSVDGTQVGGFYVATGGSDSADGSLVHPFASLARAVQAMEGSTLHTTYLQGGNYGLTSTLTLTAADSGFSIVGYNNQRPVVYDANGGLSALVRLNGASNVTFSGIAFNASGREGIEINGGSGNVLSGNRIKDAGTAVVLNGSTGNTLSGNEVDNSANIAFELKDGANNNLIASNFVNGVGGSSTYGGSIYAHGVNNNQISHNLIQHTGGSAITFVNYDFATINVGNTVDYNRVLDSGYATGYDSGSIYVLGRSYVDTKMTINNNYIDDTGAGGDSHTIALYLDDDASGVSVTNNIARNVGTHAFQIHGGHDNSVVNNILDLDATTNSAGFFQAIEDTPASTGRMYNNTVQRNIIEAHKPQTVYENFHGGSFSIFNNLYFNDSGGVLRFNPDASDTAPKFGNPLFQNEPAGNYALQSGSAASQIGFVPIDQSSIGLNTIGPHWYA